ncbi:MAG: hypothetical protein ABIA74_02625 [bacterium]
MKKSCFSFGLFWVVSLFLSFIKINSMPGMPMIENVPQPNSMPLQPIPIEQPVMPISPMTQMQVPPPPLPEPMPMSVPVSMPIQSSQMPIMNSGRSMGAQTVLLQDETVGNQGNWVKKREWLKYSLEVNDQIQDLVDQIEQSRGSYTNKINSIDNELDNFYRQIGFKYGEMQTVFDELLNYLEKRRQKKVARIKATGEDEGVTSEMEVKIDIVEDEIKSMKNNLEQFNLDMKSIEDLDKSLQDRVNKLDEQINIAKLDAQKANDLIRDIWNMIDDKKARLAYYELKGNILEKIKVSKQYVQTTLMRNMDSVLSSIRSQISQVRSGITNLENNGFIVINRAKRLEELKLKELDALRAGQQIQKEIEVKKEEAESKDKIFNFFVDLAAKIYKWYKTIVNFLSGESQQKVKSKKPKLPQLQVAEPQQVIPVAQPVMPIPETPKDISQLSQEPMF